MTLRLKLLLAVIVMVFAGLLVSDVVTYTSLKSFLLNRVDQQLLVGRIAMRQHFGGGTPFEGPGGFGEVTRALAPPGTLGEIRDASGQVLDRTVLGFEQRGQLDVPEPDLPSPIPLPDSGEPEFFTVGSVQSSLNYRVLAQRITFVPSGQPGILIVAIPFTELRQTLGRLVLIEVLVTLLVVAGLGFLSWWLVRRELRPLQEIGVTAGAIAAGDLAQRVPQQDPRTEVGQLAVALNAMLAQIEEAFAERTASEQRLRRFLADASHELRTPLTSIRGYAELFRRGARKRETDLAKSMQRIEDESARMGVMVEDLLLLARLDQARPLDLGQVDLVALAADAVEDAKATDGKRPITLEAPTPVNVRGDEARLRQVATNLIDNALTHTPRGTTVTVRALADGADAILEVADRGPGLTAEQAEKVFEPFYRSDPSRRRSTGGAGLGLAIVAAIARAHGGRVHATETPGGGATFRFTIPIDGVTNAEAAEQDDERPSA
jgi:two-component system OmpR family sensor kinase